MHCVGRTRSIIGAETLRALGVRKPVLALENGTQGWELAGLARECGAERVLAASITPEMRSRALSRATAFCRRHRIARIDAATLAIWRANASRSLFLLDVRTSEEYNRSPVSGAAQAPGGQLVQATDHRLAVRGARVVVWDESEFRAAVTAYWLRAMGWEASILAGPFEVAVPAGGIPAGAAAVDVDGLSRAIASGSRPVDIRPSVAFRKGHVQAAVSCIRPRLANVSGLSGGRFIVIGDDAAIAELAGAEILCLGAMDALIHIGGPGQRRVAGIPVTSNSDDPRIPNGSTPSSLLPEGFPAILPTPAKPLPGSSSFRHNSTQGNRRSIAWCHTYGMTRIRSEN